MGIILLSPLSLLPRWTTTVLLFGHSLKIPSMLYIALLAWTLVLPTALSVDIETHHTTITETICSTRYGRNSIQSLPTGTIRKDIELAPVMLHNSTTVTKTITPKPFQTYFSQLETTTKWVTSAPVNGTFDITSTKFDTSTGMTT